MTKHEFETVILPFLDYYFEKTNYYNILDDLWCKPIRIGKMVLFCSKLYVPDDIIIVDDDDNIIDGYHVCRDNDWKGEKILNKLISLGVYTPEE
jgi:hypothetical protein